MNLRSTKTEIKTNVYLHLTLVFFIQVINKQKQCISLSRLKDKVLSTIASGILCSHEHLLTSFCCFQHSFKGQRESKPLKKKYRCTCYLKRSILSVPTVNKKARPQKHTLTLHAWIIHRAQAILVHLSQWQRCVAPFASPVIVESDGITPQVTQVCCVAESSETTLHSYLFMPRKVSTRSLYLYRDQMMTEQS